MGFRARQRRHSFGERSLTFTGKSFVRLVVLCGSANQIMFSGADQCLGRSGGTKRRQQGASGRWQQRVARKGQRAPLTGLINGGPNAEATTWQHARAS
jgi:hypothetical protein